MNASYNSQVILNGLLSITKVLDRQIVIDSFWKYSSHVWTRAVWVCNECRFTHDRSLLYYIGDPITIAKLGLGVFLFLDLVYCIEEYYTYPSGVQKLDFFDFFATEALV